MDWRQEAFVAEKFCGAGGGVVWNFYFRRNLTDIEISDFAALPGILDKVYVSVGGYDERLWKPAVKGQFSVESFCNVLADSSDRGQGWQSFWNPYVPPRVLVFCWVTRKHKILTIDKLQRRKYFLVNGCPMCLKDKETTHHLLMSI